ncbi:MAG: molecular chaperone HtpG [Candidatus Kapabacteria bacterium]|jgi:molecular chaperone HtpG|nr:molecular chaperone HtpG [Candidatus Kapabacteria bacterium]
MSNDISAKPQEFEFKAEMKQLLHLIIHSLYTHPEVFLRELVSNASDAMNKVRVKKLTDAEIISPDAELRININVNKETKTFTIEDFGIGMTHEELVNQLGVVASSGTLNFLKELKESGKPLDANLIGQFGVGFYSVFMVTDEVAVETRSAEPFSKSWKWTSGGESTYNITEGERDTRGTKITFKLKENYHDFAEDWKIKSILTKYSNFVEFPIYVNGEKANQVQALWHKKKEEVKDDELVEFYKFVSNDYQEPLGHLHLNIEGNVNFKALLFVPQVAPPTLFRDFNEKSVQLYSNKIFIQENAVDLLPEYLRFIRGVVDTEDLPLNVSREVTQNSPVMTKIRNIISSRILSLLEEWADKDKVKYNKFFNEFGALFKTGLNSDFSNKDKITELLRFESSEYTSDELRSLNAYVAAMKPEQKEIYFAAGNSREQLEKNPNLEYFKKNHIEVLYFLDPVDLFIMPYLFEYDGKKIVSIEKAELEDNKIEQNDESLGKDAAKSLIDEFKRILGDRVEDVTISKRLVDSPASVVVGKEGIDPQMEKMMKLMDKEFKASKRILEINPNHKLIQNLSNLFISGSQPELFSQSILQIYEGAMLIDGNLNNPNDFVSRMNELLTIATK